MTNHHFSAKLARHDAILASRSVDGAAALLGRLPARDPRLGQDDRRRRRVDRHHALARKYLPRGAGSVFTFGVAGGYEAGVRVVERCSLISHLANIGDTRSLILHPASTTHRQLGDAQRVAAGAGDDVVRLSVGLETADDIIADLRGALA